MFLPGQPTPTGPGKRVKFVKELDEAVYERSRLKKIRDLPATDEIQQMRQLDNVWAPLLNEGTLVTLQRTVNYTARVIAGLFRPTDIDSLYLEANVLNIIKTVDDKVMAGIERHRPRPEGEPPRNKALGPTPRVRAGKARHTQC